MPVTHVFAAQGSTAWAVSEGPVRQMCNPCEVRVLLRNALDCFCVFNECEALNDVNLYNERDVLRHTTCSVMRLTTMKLSSSHSYA
jgi:hypothetical protein